jgi:hypothetical protein
MNTFTRDEVVAVMQMGSESPFESMSIATVGEANANGVRLNDGRQYQLIGDQWVSEDDCTYLIPATPWHIAVVHKRCLQPIQAKLQIAGG